MSHHHPNRAEFARGFRLHRRNGQALDGAEFPSGHVVIVDDPADGLVSGARSLEDLLRGGYDGRIEWADPGTCDASALGLFGRPVGPCVLRHQHDGPVHKDATGTTWSRIPDTTTEPAP